MRKSAFERLAEEQLYQIVVDEIKRDEKREGLWAKALVEAEGDKEKTQALYIKLRVQSLKDELEYAEYAAAEEADRAERDRAEAAKREAKADAEAKKREKAERDEQKRRINVAEAELRRLGIKFTKTNAGWTIISRGANTSFGSIDELESYLSERIQASKTSKLHDAYLMNRKRALRERQHRVYQVAKDKNEWCLERINGSYEDRQIFNDFEKLQHAVDQIIANESQWRRPLGCQTLILLPAAGLLILAFIAVIAG
jgi:hypothetical protein